MADSTALCRLHVSATDTVVTEKALSVPQN